MNRNEIIKALRCSATPPNGREHDCSKCPYRLLEPYDEKFPVPYDVEIDGQRYYESCDCDRMVMDAANMLEKYKRSIDNASINSISVTERK